MTIQGKVSARVDLQQGQAFDLGSAVLPVLKEYGAYLTNGVGAGQADKIFHDQRTLAASANEDLDLNGAGLTDAFGAALAFVKVKAVIVSAAAANPNPITLGGAAANGFISWVGSATDKVSIRPGATLALIAGAADASGYAVTAATADLLRVTAGAGGNHTYDVIVIGTSA